MERGEGVEEGERRAGDEEEGQQQQRREEGDGESPPVDAEEAAPIEDGRSRWRRRRRERTDSEQPTDWCNLLLLSLVTGFACIFVFAWVEAFREGREGASSSCPILSAPFNRGDGVPVDPVFFMHGGWCRCCCYCYFYESLTAEAPVALLCSVSIERKNQLSFTSRASSR